MCNDGATDNSHFIFMSDYNQELNSTSLLQDLLQPKMEGRFVKSMVPDSYEKLKGPGHLWHF